MTRDFAFSGMVACGHCGRSLVGGVKKGRYVYYHCTGYRGKCGEPYTREETLKSEFANRLRELALPREVLEWLEAEQVNAEKTAQTAQAEAMRRHEADLERLRRRRGMLYEDRLDGRIDAATYDAKVEQIQLQQEQGQERIRGSRASRSALADHGNGACGGNRTDGALAGTAASEGGNGTAGGAP